MRNRAVKVTVTVNRVVARPVVKPAVAGKVSWTPGSVWWSKENPPAGWIAAHGLEHIMSSCASPMCVCVRKMILSGDLVKGKDF